MCEKKLVPGSNGLFSYYKKLTKICIKENHQEQNIYPIIFKEQNLP